MQIFKNSALAAGLMIVIASLSFVGCGGASEEIRVDGSSTVEPISSAIAEEFRNVNSDVQVSVKFTGTTAGFEKFAAGEAEICDASRPIKSSEMEKLKKAGIDYIELPVAIDGLSVVVGKDNDFCKSLTVDQLYQIFAKDGSARKWSDLNPEWDAEPIEIWMPGSESGTYDYFEEAVIHKIGGKEALFRVDDTNVSGDDNQLVTGVSGSKYAIGFFGYAHLVQNKAKVHAVAIDGGNGPVAPTADTIENGTYVPLSRPLFIYVSKEASTKAHVREFVDFYLDTVVSILPDVGYVALPSATYTLVKERWENGTTGSIFNGEGGKPGVKLSTLLKGE